MTAYKSSAHDSVLCVLGALLLLAGVICVQAPGEALGESTHQEGSEQPVYPLATDGDPVDLATGLYSVEESDFVFPDWIPIVMTRVYRSEDSASRAFGVGASHPFEIYLLRNDLCTEMRLILPDGAFIQFLRTAGTNCLDATLAHKTSPTVFYNSSLFWNKDTQQWELNRQDGISYRFNEFLSLTEVEDAQRHRLTVGRDSYQRVTSVTSPCGYWIKLVRDSQGKIIRIEDFLGRHAMYEYDARGRLARVEYPTSGRIAVYTYDSEDRMVSVGDEHGLRFWNIYDKEGRVMTQRHTDGTTYEFRYVVTESGTTRQTLVKNRQGKLRVATFNDAGRIISDTWDAEGMRPRTMNYKWDASTNQLAGVMSWGAAENIFREPALSSVGLHSGQKEPDQLAAEYRAANHLAGQITDDELRALAKPCEPVSMRKKMAPRKQMTREGVLKLWDDLMREEGYQSIEFLSAESHEPTESGVNTSGWIVVEDRRSGYLGGLFGYSRGGGWKVEGRLLDEVPVEGGLWQLYAKRVTKWSPSLGEMVAAKPSDSAPWEFQVLLRNPMSRSEVRELQSFVFPQNGAPQGGVPQAALRYDPTNHKVWVVISGGLSKPLIHHIPIVPSFFPYRGAPDERLKYQPSSPTTLEG